MKGIPMTTEATHATETAAPAAPADPVSGPDVATTVARLRATFATGRTRNLEWRKAQLLALKRLMEENETKIADALEKDLGRSPFEAWLADVANTVGECTYAAKNVGKWAKRRHRLLEMSQLPARGFVTYAPYATAPRPRIGRVRAVRHRADHRRMELPVRVDAGSRRRRDRRR